MKKDKQSIVFRELSNGSGNARSLTSADNWWARCVYNNVRASGVGTTIAKDVADYFRNADYKVVKQGIGWRITLQ